MRLWATLSVTCVLLVACGARTGVSDDDAGVRPDAGPGDDAGPPERDAGRPPVGCVGSEPVRLATATDGSIFHVSVDATHVYTAQEPGGRVLRVPICGGELEVLAEDEPRPFDVASDGTWVYWTNTHVEGTVVRRRIAGGPTEVLWDEGGQPESLRLDGEHVYVTAISAFTGAGLWRVRRSGSDLRPLMDGEVGREIAIDETHVYFSQEGDLLRVAKDGGEPELLLERGDAPVATIEVDARFVYWTSWIGPGSPVPNVVRMPKDGGPVETLADGESGPVVGLGVTPTHVYWTSQSEGAVRGRALAGGPVVTIATGQPVVEHLALTPRAIVWVNFRDGGIWRAPRL